MRTYLKILFSVPVAVTRRSAAVCGASAAAVLLNVVHTAAGFATTAALLRRVNFEVKPC
jgi:hypothetical protein